MPGMERMTVARCAPGGSTEGGITLIVERPLEVVVDGARRFTVARTPRDERAHAAGLCLSAGLVARVEDIRDIQWNGPAPDLVEVRLSRPAPDPAPPPAPVVSDFRVACSRALELPGGMTELQQLHMETRSAHAAVVYGPDLSPLTWAEDVGRHNAMDKAFGKVLLDGALPRAAAVQLTCRMNREVVHKCARARIPVVLSVSRPTADAVAMAQGLGLTLACLDRTGGLWVFTHPERILPD